MWGGFIQQQLSGVWDFVHAEGNFESHLHKLFSVNLKCFSEATSQINLPLIVFLLWLTDSVLSLCVLPVFVSHMSEQNALSSQGVPAAVLLLIPDCWLIYLKRCPFRRVSPTNRRQLITVTEHTASLELMLWTLILCWDHDHGFLWRNLFLLQFLNSIYKAKDPLSHRGIGGLGQNQEATAWPGTGDVQEHSSAMGDKDLGHGLQRRGTQSYWRDTMLIVNGHAYISTVAYCRTYGKIFTMNNEYQFSMKFTSGNGKQRQRQAAVPDWFKLQKRKEVEAISLSLSANDLNRASLILPY